MKSFILFFALLTSCYGAKLPSYIAQCSKSDPNLSECLQNSVSRAWPTIVKGDKTYHIQPLNPLKVSFIHINVDNTLQSNLSSVLLDGLENTEIKEIKWDLAKQRVETKFIVPQLKFTTDYVLRGRILGLPIEGDGVCDVSLENMDNKHSFEYNIVERNGKEYMDIKQTEMSYTTSKIHFDLRNLFNGEVHLGKAMNEVLNENWDAVNKEVNPYFGNAVGEVYAQVLQAFFNRVSLNEFFSNYA